MTVRNEAHRYLGTVLRAVRRIADRVVIIDDASTDETPQSCREILGDRLTLIQNERSWFEESEALLRAQQWEAVAATQPDWVLYLDADEVLEPRAAEQLLALMSQQRADVIAMRLFDMWDADHYRQDRHWTAHTVWWPVMVRHRDGFVPDWPDQTIHVGRVPQNIHQRPTLLSELRIQHLGWSTPTDRVSKAARYRRLDPGAEHGDAGQYASILDRDPALVPWNPTGRYQAPSGPGTDTDVSRFVVEEDPTY